jgi:hypothetical protein
VASGFRTNTFLLALLLTTPAHALRVVSLNLCADDYAALLAPESVAALTPLAADPSVSPVAEAAGGTGAHPARRLGCRPGNQGFRILWFDRLTQRSHGPHLRHALPAAAFASEPEVFLLDEPTTDLDPAAARKIMTPLRDTAHGTPARGVVVVMHALDLALRYADRMLVLREGRIVADAPPLDALPDAAAAFGLPFGSDSTPHLLPP